MLFMGTSKYPTENAYDSFLSSNGGSDNAYTGEFQWVYLVLIMCTFYIILILYQTYCRAGIYTISF